MDKQNKLMEGRPDLRSRFEKIIVVSTEEKVESFTALEVLALRVGNSRTVYPSKIDEYPGMLKKFLNDNNNKTISPFIAKPLLNTLTDVIIFFYKENIKEFVNELFEIKKSKLSNEVRFAIQEKVKDGFIDKAFKLSIQETLNGNINNVIITTFTTLARVFVTTVIASLLIGGKIGAITFGVGTAIMVGVIIDKAVTFKSKFKRKLSLQIKAASYELYEKLNIRLYNLLKEGGFLNET